MAKQPASPSSGSGDPQGDPQQAQQDPQQDEQLWTRWRDFGRELFALRSGRGLAVRQLADKAGVSPQTIVDLERGWRQLADGVRVLPNPRDDVLGRIAGGLAVKPERLFARVGRHAERPQTRKGWRGYARGQAGSSADELEQRLARTERRLERVAEKLGVDLDELEADEKADEAPEEPPRRHRRPAG
jgi:transcriptional regulator with XRE-family HTH domain